MGDKLKAVAGAVSKAPVAGLAAAGVGEMAVRGGSEGVKEHGKVVAGVTAASLTPGLRAILRKGGPALAAFIAGADAGETLEAGVRAVQDWVNADNERRASESKYGTVEAATRTRNRRARSREISDRVKETRERLIAQGSLPEGSMEMFSRKQIAEDLNEGVKKGQSPRDALTKRAVGGKMREAQIAAREKKKESKGKTREYYSRGKIFGKPLYTGAKDAGS
jgi:hypothetical protein